MAEPRCAVVPFYSQLSFVLSSVPAAQWLQSGLHLKCVCSDGSIEIDEEFRSYLKFLSELPDPVVFNAPVFFADNFKRLVMELFNVLFSSRDSDVSLFIGDILCRLLQGASCAAKTMGTSVVQQFFLDPDGSRDQCIFDLLNQFAVWRQQVAASSTFHFSPSIQAEYESQHPYVQKHCEHSVKFSGDVQHMEVNFDSRSQTCALDRLEFRNSSKEKVLLNFSGTSFTKSRDADSQAGSIVLAGNELEAIFECIDASFEEEQALWGYKFTVSGFPVGLAMRQSMDAVAAHLKTLFEDLLMIACTRDDQFFLPLELLDSDDMVNEASLVFSEKLVNIQVRKALEQVFFDECSSGTSVFKRFVKLFQRSIESAATSHRTVPVSASCGRCTAGHLCKVINGIPQEPMYNSGYWSCDICKKSMSRGQADVWHCSACLYDVCPDCQPHLLQMQNSEFHVGDVVHLVPSDIADYRSFSDASSGPMLPGVEYLVKDVRPPHVYVEGTLQ
jgi:hypothetical protein